MEKYKVLELKNKATWENFVLKFKPYSFLQSWNWGETNKQMGNTIHRLGFYKHGKLVGVCQLISQDAKRGKHLTVPAGPLMDWKDGSLVKLFVSTIKEYATREGGWFVRVRPELLGNLKNSKMFAELGFVSSPMHLHAENTWVLDISPSEEELLSSMRKQTRYSIRQSLVAGLSVEKTNGLDRIYNLSKLQRETARRHGFVPFSEQAFIAQMRVFGKDNQAMQFTVKKDKIVLATAIIIFYGDTAYYHYSASSTKYLKIPSSYFLQWAVIKEAKLRGCRYYNFWGIAPTNDPNHRFHGVTIFKTGFGGERVDWLHAHDLPVSSKYWSTYIFEHIRKRIRRL